MVAEAPDVCSCTAGYHVSCFISEKLVVVGSGCSSGWILVVFGWLYPSAILQVWCARVMFLLCFCLVHCFVCFVLGLLD